MASVPLSNQGRNTASRQTTRLLRLLAILCGLEAGAGLFKTGLSLFVYSYPRESFLHESSHALYVFYSVVAINVAFMMMLVISARFLWDSDRKGLRFLTWTLCAEILYGVGILILGAAFGIAHAAGSGAAFYLTILDAANFGNDGLLVQVLTAFPVVASALILLGYRSLRIAS